MPDLREVESTLILLNDNSGRLVVVRVWDVSLVRQQGRRGKISLRNGETVVVKQTVEQILGKMTGGY